MQEIKPPAIENDRMDRFVVISGCSGGGKSTLISELSRRGYDVVEEHGRRRSCARAVPRSHRLIWVPSHAVQLRWRYTTAYWR